MLRLLTTHTSSRLHALGSHEWLSTLLMLIVVVTLVFVPIPFSIGVLFAPVAAIVVLLNPVLLVLGLVISVPIQDAIPVPDAVPITATRAAIAAAVILLPLVLIRRNSAVQWSWLMLPILLFMGTMAVSLVNANNLGDGIAELYRWTVALGALWLTLQFVQTRRLVVLGLAVISILAITQGSLGIAQALTGAGPDSFQLGAGFSRAFGTFGMPNSFAAYMEMVALPMIPLAIWAGNRAIRSGRDYMAVRNRGYLASTMERYEAMVSAGLFALFSLGMIVGLAAIAISFSRGGWVGTAAGLGVIVLLLGQRAIFTALATVLTLSFGLVIGASGAIITVIEERFVQLVDQVRIGDVRGMPVTDDNFAAIERMSHWQTAIAMWDQSPWLGVGVGNFNERFTEFAIHPQFSQSQGHAHNYYLHLLAETGIAGLFAYGLLIFSVLVIGWKAYRNHDSLAQAIGIGVVGTTTALLVHNLFENLHVLNISVQMMFLWALAIIAVRLSAGHSDEMAAFDSAMPDRIKYDFSGRAPRARDIDPTAPVREHN